MGNYEQSTEVAAPADALFDYLAEVGNLPHYFARMTSAERTGPDEVHTTARVEGREVGGEAWFRVDEPARKIAWGSEGPNDYHGELEVTGEGERSQVAVRLSTEHAEGSAIQQGLEETLANVKRVVEGG
jgi:uncharacterized membrane protein